MLKSLVRVGKDLGSKYAEYRHHILVRLMRVCLSLSIIALCFWLIGKQLIEGLHLVAHAEVRFSTSQLIISSVCILAGSVLGAWEWTLLVASLGGHLDQHRGLYIHLTANLAKYIPGFIWPYAGKVYLTVRQNVSPNIAVLSIVCEFIVLYLTGIMLALLCLPYSDLVSWPFATRLVFQLAGVLLTAIVIFSTPFVIEFLIKKIAPGRSGDGAEMVTIDRSKFSFAMVAVLLTWFIVCLGFSYINPVIVDYAWQYILRSVIAVIAALLMGQLAFLVPLGVGVREAILVALLGSQSTGAIVVLMALVFRLEMLAAEAVGALAALIGDRLRIKTGNNP